MSRVMSVYFDEEGNIVAYSYTDPFGCRVSGRSTKYHEWDIYEYLLTGEKKEKENDG